MNTFTTILLLSSLFMLVSFLEYKLENKFLCDCGRTRPWYFYAERHVVGGYMLGQALWNTTFTILMVVLLAPVTAVIFSLFAVWAWRTWWFHEKDKLKKKAAKLAGKVSFNKHGKLVVVNDK